MLGIKFCILLLLLNDVFGQLDHRQIRRRKIRRNILNYVTDTSTSTEPATSPKEPTEPTEPSTVTTEEPTSSTTKQTTTITTEQPTTVTTEQPTTVTTEQPTTVTTEQPTTVTTEQPTTVTTEQPTTVTTEQPTTITTEQPTTTTEHPTTTPSPLFCNSSLHNKEDLKEIIVYFDKKANIKSQIIDKLYKQAIEVNDKHSLDLETFIDSFNKQPAHLKHVLEDIRTTKKNLQPALSEIKNLSQEYPSLQKEYDEKILKSKTVLKKIHRQLQLCKITCGDEELVERRSFFTTKEPVPYNPNEYYCSSIAAIHKTIIQHLSNYLKEIENKTAADIDEKDVKYETAVQEVKKNLKDAAIGEFGWTMYDILSLQDMYYHLSEEIISINSKKILNAIKSNLVNVDPKLMLLETALNRLTDFCKQCSEQSVPRSRRLLSNEQVGKMTEEKNILDELLEAEQKKLESEVADYFSIVFSRLEAQLKNAQNTTIYIEELKEVETEIKSETQQELSVFQQLLSVVHDPRIGKLNDLQLQSEQLLKTYDKEIIIINNFIDDHKKK